MMSRIHCLPWRKSFPRFSLHFWGRNLYMSATNDKGNLYYCWIHSTTRFGRTMASDIFGTT